MRGSAACEQLKGKKIITDTDSRTIDRSGRCKLCSRIVCGCLGIRLCFRGKQTAVLLWIRRSIWFSEKNLH